MMKELSYRDCRLCPRQCGVDRSAGERGYCGGGDYAQVAKVMLHHWEEPVLAGKGGSGAIFFGGCTLGCSYCQNRAISQRAVGRAVDGPGLRQLMEGLIAQGADNIDLVTPTHYLPTVAQALHAPLPVPVVYNCGGYERPRMLAQLEGKVDIYLPDLKYAEDALGEAFSGVKDYVNHATAAIGEMYRQTGPAVIKDGRMVSGVLIRHLVLPGQVENSLKVLDWIGEHFAPGQVLVSLMSQYTPMPGMAAPMDRAVTAQEYDGVLSWMYLNGLQGFTQEISASDRGFIPDF